MAEGRVHLSRAHKALDSIPSTTKLKHKAEKENKPKQTEGRASQKQ